MFSKISCHGRCSFFFYFPLSFSRGSPAFCLFHCQQRDEATTYRMLVEGLAVMMGAVVQGKLLTKHSLICNLQMAVCPCTFANCTRDMRVPIISALLALSTLLSTVYSPYSHSHSPSLLLLTLPLSLSRFLSLSHTLSNLSTLAHAPSFPLSFEGFIVNAFTKAPAGPACNCTGPTPIEPYVLNQSVRSHIVCQNHPLFANNSQETVSRLFEHLRSLLYICRLILAITGLYVHCQGTGG